MSAGATMPAADGAPPSLAANASMFWVLFVGRAAASLITSALVARTLGPVGRGEVTFVVNASGLLALIGSAGMVATMLRSLRLRHSHPRDLYTDGLDVGMAWAAVMVAGLVILAIASPDRRMEAGFMAAALLPQIAQQSLINAATLDNRVRPIAWTSLVGVGLYALGTVAQVLLGTATSVNNLVLWISCTGIATVLLAWACNHRFSRRRPRVFRWFAVRSIRATVASATVLAIWRIDVLIVRTERGLAELGQYSVAVGAAELLSTLGMGVTAGVLPSIVHDDDAAETVCRVTRTTLLALGAIAVVMALAAPFAIPLVFGHAYAHAVPAFVLLLPGLSCFVLHAPLFNFVTSHGGTASLTRLGVGALVTNVVGNVVALHFVDFTAAAVMSSLSYLFLFGGCLVLFARTAHVPLLRALRPERRDVVDALRSVRTMIAARS